MPVLEDSDFESDILKEEVELVVEILTSHLCSDEGLEDCTDVLISLSISHLSLRIQVLRHLLKGNNYNYTREIEINVIQVLLNWENHSNVKSVNY